MDSPNDKKLRVAPIWYFLASMAIVVLMQHLFVSAHVEMISYSQFKSLVKKDLVNDLIIHETVIKGNLKGAALKVILTPDKLKEISPEALAGKTLIPFETVRVADPGLTGELEAANIPFRGEVTSNWLATLLSWIVPAALFFLIWSYLGKKMGSASGGLMQIGKSKAKVYIEKKTGVTFADVAGIDEAEEEVAEVVGFLKGSGKVSTIGRAYPQGSFDRRTAGHGENFARPRRRWRSWRAVL